MTSPVKILLIAALLLPVIKTQAQHEISFEAGNGISTFRQNVEFGDQKNGWAGVSGLGYAYSFSPKLSIRSGINLAYYHAKVTLSNFSDAYDAYDGEEYFEFRFTVNHYEEKLSTLYLNIPLMIQAQQGNRHKFYVAAGGMLGIPLRGKYEVTSSRFKTSGYYPSHNVEFDEPEFMGFGAFSDLQQKGSFDLHILLMLSLEAGMKWQLSEAFALYTGAYVDYSLTNVVRNNHTDKPLIQYNTNSSNRFSFNGIPTSNYTDSNNVIHSFTKNINPVAIGIKVRIGMLIDNNK